MCIKQKYSWSSNKPWCYFPKHSDRAKVTFSRAQCTLKGLVIDKKSPIDRLYPLWMMCHIELKQDCKSKNTLYPSSRCLRPKRTASKRAWKKMNSSVIGRHTALYIYYTIVYSLEFLPDERECDVFAAGRPKQQGGWWLWFFQHKPCIYVHHCAE